MSDQQTATPAKLTEMHSVRIPAALKEKLERMSPSEKSVLNAKIREEIARAVHNSMFDPALYLSD